ncbi:MAG TPA: gamma-glutamylcyclotransferase family protein [Terriglobales bacterium]|nr:gamma-glutamylcyclotransferase family protein [Terriglobales bacterium]
MPLIFAYGSLQQAQIQLVTFGRRLRGADDMLVGYDIVRSADGRHATVTFTGRSDSRVPGTAFEVTDAELTAADAYERRDGYERISTVLASGTEAWVYVDKRATTPPSWRETRRA